MELVSLLICQSAAIGILFTRV